ncbi:E3 ubiquitin-protein ligase RAD18 [Talaromyces islandicus]|uniref:Postreplication repair E3 ubiquitin-protein ligase RAD18 n=1 Tax=Talaromyces islandicus TaxID=28573 RepID=A0A0U1LMN2_TALIS|nr:E3 ubiquitin-protein ligase RAD18 [Talaromyces islandicus]
MDQAFDIPDSTDWLNTPVSDVASLESALRCQVCKDFFDNPVITSCSHTFCSLCIRRCLSAEGKCPACRTQDQELKLRRNWAVQELVDSFQKVRRDLLNLAQASAVPDTEDIDTSQPLAKRRRLDNPTGENVSSRPEMRRTRSQPKAVEVEPTPIPVDEDPQDDDFVPDDGLVACPMCNRRMKEETVFSHLDICKGPTQRTRESRITRAQHPLQSQHSQQQQITKPPERLPVINYSLLKENAFRKKLKDLGIPDWGPRPLLQRRHTEWMNLWNANCDAKLPKSKRELLRDLEIWERTQGGMAPSLGPPAGPNAIMAKSFDASAWSTSHDDDFRRLIENARKKKDVHIRPKDSGVTAQGSENQPDDANLSSSIAQVQVSTLPEAPVGLGNPTGLGNQIELGNSIELNNALPSSERPSQPETNTAEVQNGSGGVVLDTSLPPFS